MAGRYFRLSSVVTTAVAIGRIVGSLFSRDQLADRKEAKRRQKENAALLHRYKTQDSDRARAAAALVAAARSRAETSREEEPLSPEMK
jgi:F0F1-type ATP synthase membrane subunit b/b'